ncbi:hypothetical protein [uncultured Chryseobacterium sp.]|uniref:hypothetical protein n=1 Tax=uncultured Chryseobacterium sp. TaxID=259322 RepID=UPI0025CEF9A9|nr:hypothetical protein [uncultured Chryseobacterium sp.]
MKKHNIVLVSGLILFAVSMYLFIKKVSSPKYHDEQQSQIFFKTTLKNKYRDHNNHGVGVFDLSNGTKYVLPKSDLYYYINVGDSLIKEKDSLKLKVIRKDSIFHFDLRDSRQ